MRSTSVEVQVAEFERGQLARARERLVKAERELAELDRRRDRLVARVDAARVEVEGWQARVGG